MSTADVALNSWVWPSAFTRTLPNRPAGIETDTEWHLLQSLGCGLGQGFYFSRPVPPTEIAPKLAATNGTAVIESGSTNGNHKPLDVAKA